MLAALLLAFAVGSSTPLPARGAPAAFWVDCEHGDDTASGTSAHEAFATLRKARDAVRALARSPGDGATVSIVGGRVCRSWLQQDEGGSRGQNRSLRLDGRDSRVSWQVVGRPSVLSGGVPVNTSDWQPLSPAQQRLFKSTARDHVMSLDLRGVVADVGSLKGLSYTGGDACIKTQFFEEAGLELLHAPPAGEFSAAGRKLVMARFPDLIEPPVPENWLDYRDPNNTALAITIDASAEQKAAWAAQVASGGQLFSHGLWTFNWADSHRRVLQVSGAADGGGAIDGGGVRLALQQHGDFTDRDCQLSAAAANEQGGHVYVYNAHYELDSPGEYSVDHVSQTLFFWPPAKLVGGTELSVATSLLDVTGATDITFSGLDFRGARGAGVVIVNSTNIVLADSVLSDAGMSLLNVTGGAKCGARNMTLLRGGTGGAVLEGGDRQTLRPSAHFVRGSTVRDSNRWVMNYAPLVLMAGVGQIVSGSLLADAPQMAAFVQGNSHLLENSTIRDVVQQCNDCGAFYFGRDWTYRGMRIQNCTFTLPGPMWDMPWGANGVYADDFGSSVAVVDSTFNLGAKMRMVFFSNGGRDHRFVGNVVRPLAPNTASSPAPVARLNSHCQGACTDCLFSEPYHTFLERVPYNTSSIWVEAFPQLASMMQYKPCEGAGTIVANNTVCFAGGGAALVDNSAIAKFDSTGDNNRWDDKICNGKAPPAPPPPPPPAPSGCASGTASGNPVLRLVQPTHGKSCSATYKASSSWSHNPANGGIYSQNGPHAGRVVAIDCCDDARHCGDQPHEEPVVAASADGSEFKTLKNAVFDAFPTAPRPGSATQIKLTKSEKCLVANGTVVSLDSCVGAGATAEWTVQTGVGKAFVLVSKSTGACFV